MRKSTSQHSSWIALSQFLCQLAHRRGQSHFCGRPSVDGARPQKLGQSPWIALSIAAGLAVLGCLATVASAETPSRNGPGEDRQIMPPAKYDPATVKPAAEKPAAVKPAADMPASPRKIRFQFRFTPWRDALEWFARQADLSLVADATPPGTLNYTDDREYTPAEALDLLNGVLLTKGYTLVRRERLLMLINLEDGIPPNLVPTITPEALDSRGEYELVGVRFNLKKITPEEAEAEISKLLGPQGSVVPLPRARQILVTETAGHLREIQSILARIEQFADDKEGPSEVMGVPRARLIPVYNTQAQEVADVVRQVYGGRIVEGPGTTRGGTRRTATSPETSPGATGLQRGVGEESLRISVGVDTRSNSLIVVAPRPLFHEIQQLVEELDEAAGEDQTTRVVRLHRVTPEAVQQALTAAGGGLVQFGHPPGTPSGKPVVPGKPSSSSQGAGAAPDQAPRTQLPRPGRPAPATGTPAP
jgi:type II secretory pathway component GspD/PulD (secretin)